MFDTASIALAVRLTSRISSYITFWRSYTNPYVHVCTAERCDLLILPPQQCRLGSYGPDYMTCYFD